MAISEIVLLTVALLVFLAAVSIAGSTLVTGISPMPSPAKARSLVLQLAEEALAVDVQQDKEQQQTIYDLGSGWGHLLIPLAQRYPQHRIIGYEMSWLPWLVSAIWIRMSGLNNVQVVRQNFLKQDLAEARVWLCYLYPGGMQAVSDKLADAGHKPGYLISNNFALPGHQALKTEKANDFYKSPVYLYKFGSNHDVQR